MEKNPTTDQVSTQEHASNNNNNNNKITVIAHNKVTAVPQQSPQPKSVQRSINNKDSSTMTTTTTTTTSPNKKKEQRCVTEIVHNDHGHSKQNLAILCIGLYEDQQQKKPLMDVDSYPWSTIPRREIKPTQAALQEEIIRRSKLRNLSHTIKPFAWSRPYCIEWLMKHPIQGTVDIQFLHSCVQILKQKLFKQPKPTTTTTTTTNGWNHSRIPVHGTGQYRAPYNTTNNNNKEPVFILPAPIQPKVSQQDTNTTQPEWKHVTNNTNLHKPMTTTTVTIKPKPSHETNPTVPVTQKKRNRDEINLTTTTTVAREVVTMNLNTNPSQESESVHLTTPTNKKRILNEVSLTENALERTRPMEEEIDDDDENIHRNNNNNNNQQQQQQQDHDHHVEVQLDMLQKEHQWREQEHQITMRERKFKEWCDIQVQIRLLRQDMELYNNTTNKEDDDDLMHIELVEDMKMLIQRKNEIAMDLGMKQKSSVVKQFIV